MALIRIDHNPPRRQLNVFGVAWLVFFGLVGGLVLHGGGSLAAAGALWGLAVAVPAVGWTFPGVMRIVYLATAYAAFPIGLVVSHLLLLAVYYLLLTPLGLAMKLFGYDPMHRRFDRDAPSYWIERKQDDDVRRYFRQF